MPGNYLQGFTGDKINAILAAAAFNLRIKLREIRFNLFLPFFKGAFRLIFIRLKGVFAEINRNFKTPKPAF